MGLIEKRVHEARASGSCPRGPRKWGWSKDEDRMSERGVVRARRRGLPRSTTPTYGLETAGVAGR